MPLNLSDNEFMPYLQYDAKAGRFFAKAEGALERQEIERPVMAFDMEHIKTGWIRFPKEGGSIPEYVWDGSATDSTLKAPRPAGEGWKRGFEVLVYSNAIIPGSQSKLALRTFSSNSFNVNSVIAGMYFEYENGLKDNPGKLPVFACKGIKAIPNQYGTVYEPIFDLAQWVDVGKVPAFIEYHAGRVQVLPPPRPTNGSPERVRTIPQEQHMKQIKVTPALQQVMREKRGYDLSETLDPDEMSNEVPF